MCPLGVSGGGHTVCYITHNLSMALQIDFSRALRTYDELVGLVRAVLDANKGDENIAVEWKSGYEEILSKEASFALARAILGFANRDVAHAKSAFEGVAYVVVGAEPQNLNGQEVPDSAELMNAIRRFVGSGFPRWDVRSIKVRSKDVIVLIVESPENGDRIALLQREYQYTNPKGKNTSISSGTIFVRHPGSTERAALPDLEMLQSRLVAGSERSAQILREEARIRHCRTLIAEIGQAVDRWVSTLELLVTMTAGSKWTTFRMEEFVNTDSGRKLSSDMQLIKLNARKIRLEHQDPRLISALDELLERIDDAGPRDIIAGRQVATRDERCAAYRNIFAVREACDLLEMQAADFL